MISKRASRGLGCALVTAWLAVSAGRARAETVVPPVGLSPPSPPGPAFQLRAEVDLPILGLSLAFAGARFFRTQGAYCAPLCNRDDVNSFDRVTAGYWSQGWQQTSSYGVVVLGAGAVSLLVADEGLARGLNDVAVVAEAAIASNGLASVMTLAAGRPRPYLYGDKAPLGARTSSDGALSYLSSHVAVSFAIVAASAVAMHRLHPGSRASWLVLGAGGAAASFIAVARILGGMHFITDTMGGAVVGASVGVLVPTLHASPVTVVPVVASGSSGLALTGRF